MPFGKQLIVSFRQAIKDRSITDIKEAPVLAAPFSDRPMETSHVKMW